MALRINGKPVGQSDAAASSTPVPADMGQLQKMMEMMMAKMGEIQAQPQQTVIKHVTSGSSAMEDDDFDSSESLKALAAAASQVKSEVTMGGEVGNQVVVKGDKEKRKNTLDLLKGL